MAISTKNADLRGNQILADGLTITYDSASPSAEFGVSPGHRPSVLAGTGDPNTVVSARQGSLYLNVSGSGVGNRLWVNSNGGTTWVAVTTAS